MRCSLSAGVWLDLIRPMVAFQLGVVIFPVMAYRSRSHRLVDQMRLLRRFDDLVLMNVAKGLLVAGRHGMVVRHNPHAAELLGLAGQSLHGRHIRELLAVSPAMLELVGNARWRQARTSTCQQPPASCRSAHARFVAGRRLRSACSNSKSPWSTPRCCTRSMRKTYRAMC